MMKNLRTPLRLWAFALLLLCTAARPFVAQTVTLAGLRGSANHGSFKAAQYANDGSLVLLYDQGDGLRLLRTDASGNTIEAQTILGAAGDTGVALAQDPSGDLYVAGTSTSGSLTGTVGTAFPQPADTSTNSFVAKFDPNFHLLFLTFFGAGITAVTGVAASADAVFVTGVTYSSSLPVTSAAVQRQVASGSVANGFVERFNSDGSSLVYATYLTGADGDTHPGALAADGVDNVYIAGETSAGGLPTVAALEPAMHDATAGFLSKLTPAGDAFSFSTYIPGSGITGLAFDASTHSLLLTGNVALGEFPVATVSGPIANMPYQALLRVSEDGQNVLESVLLAPGTSSTVTAAPGGTAWISGSLSVPLDTTNGVGDSYLLHATKAGSIDMLTRFGGLPVSDWNYASLTSQPAGAPAVTGDGSAATLTSTLTASVGAALAPTEHFDLPLLAGPSTALPSQPSDLLSATCGGLSRCTGSTGMLATVVANVVSPALSLSIGDLPNLTLRNLGAGTAQNLAITASGYGVATDCGSTLLPWAQCAIALSGTGPGSITVSAANAAAVILPLPASSASARLLALSTAELDFGIVTASSSPITRTLTVTNLSGEAQSFASAPDGVPGSPPYTLIEVASSCAGSASAHTVAANSACTVTLGLSASADAANDGPVRAAWQIGGRDVAVTGITQAATLSLSSASIDFGLRLSGITPALPRYLYLSNSSRTPSAHTPVTLPPSSPFTVIDGCPSTLEPGSVCRITITYAEGTAPATDSVTLTLDAGLSVPIIGEVLAAPSAPGQAANPGLAVSPAVFAFENPVVTTETSATNGVIALKNTGTDALPLRVGVIGDFQFTSGCPATLSAGAGCNLYVAFMPSQPGVRDGLLSLTTGSNFTPTTVPLTGVGAPLLPVSNGELSLGQSLVGEPAFAWYKVQAPVSSLTASASGSAFGVAIVEDSGTGHGSAPASAFAPSATGACGNCWLGVAFVPQTAGPAGSTLTLSTGAGGAPYRLTLEGEGIPLTGLVLTPVTPDFGTVPLGSVSPPLTFTLANLLSPGAPVTIESIQATGDFSVLSTKIGGPSCTGVLISTASCPVTITFTPSVIGARTGMLSIVTSAGTASVTLSGSGAATNMLSIDPIALTFSNGPANGSSALAADATVTLTNTSASPIAIGAISTSSPSFAANSTCGTLPAGAICSVNVRFTPGMDQVSATLTIPVTTTTNALVSTMVYTVPLAGNYTSGEAGLLLVPSELNFGSQAVGTLGQTRQLTLLNTSTSTQQITLNVPQHFPLAAPFGCTTLAPGASCTFAVSFLPQTGGALTGSLLLTGSSASGETSQAIGYLLGYGEASGKLTLTGRPIPNLPVDFGTVASGGSLGQTLTLTNSGSGPLTIRHVMSAPPFLATVTCGQVLLPSDTCLITVNYSPVYEVPSGATAPPPRADAETLLIESDAASSPDTIDLSGTALPAFEPGAASVPKVAIYTLSEGALTFANTQVGNRSPSQTITVLNTGTASVSFSAVLPPTDFAATTTCATLLPGASCTLAVTFIPGEGSTATARAGTLAIQSNAVDALEFVNILGMSTPSPLVLSSLSLDFGTVELGGMSQLALTATNAASLPITFGSATVTGNFTVASSNCPGPGAPLPAGQSCTLILTFTPAASGTRVGTLSLPTSAAETPLTVALSGRAIASRLQISPGALNFGSLSARASAPLTLNVVNNGSAALTGLRYAISGANAAEFAITKPCPASDYSPFAGCTMEVSFTPTTVGVKSATLTFSSSDPAGPIGITLSGTGTPAGGFLLSAQDGSTATATVPLGASANFELTVTPQGGYTGSVALTCQPLSPAPYASCSLLRSQFALHGGAVVSTAIITTVASVRSSSLALWNLFLLIPLPVLVRRRHTLGRCVLVAIMVAMSAGLIGIAGCGSAASSGLALTPAGTYQYQVTANALNGLQLSSSVTLTVIVQ